MLAAEGLRLGGWRGAGAAASVESAEVVAVGAEAGDVLAGGVVAEAAGVCVAVVAEGAAEVGVAGAVAAVAAELADGFVEAVGVQVEAAAVPAPERQALRWVVGCMPAAGLAAGEEVALHDGEHQQPVQANEQAILPAHSE